MEHQAGSLWVRFPNAPLWAWRRVRNDVNGKDSRARSLWDAAKALAQAG